MRSSDWSSDVCSSDLQHVENALTQLGSRREDTVLARLLAVADAGEHITQGIGDRHLGISLPARLRNTGDQAVIGQFPQQIGRASVGKECVSTCRSRWSTYH